MQCVDWCNVKWIATVKLHCHADVSMTTFGRWLDGCIFREVWVNHVVWTYMQCSFHVVRLHHPWSNSIWGLACFCWVLFNLPMLFSWPYFISKIPMIKIMWRTVWYPDSLLNLVSCTHISCVPPTWFNKVIRIPCVFPSMMYNFFESCFIYKSYYNIDDLHATIKQV